MSTPHSVIHARSYVDGVEKKPDEAKDAKKKGVVSIGHSLSTRPQTFVSCERTVSYAVQNKRVYSAKSGLESVESFSRNDYFQMTIMIVLQKDIGHPRISESRLNSTFVFCKSRLLTFSLFHYSIRLN